jgi:8-oxo-dGTP pyrophosphatase MutT (NUDIX family)
MQNAFETGARLCIPSVLVYVRVGTQILMLHRYALPGKKRIWNGLGGKCEPSESPLQAAQREVHEESGLLFTPPHFQALGVLQFPHFQPKKNQDWIVFVFQVKLHPHSLMGKKVLQTPLPPCSEGELHFIPQKNLLQRELWKADPLFLPWVLQSRPFLGTIWYEKKDFRSWFQLLGIVFFCFF